MKPRCVQLHMDTSKMADEMFDVFFFEANEATPRIGVSTTGPVDLMYTRGNLLKVRPRAQLIGGAAELVIVDGNLRRGTAIYDLSSSVVLSTRTCEGFKPFG